MHRRRPPFERQLAISTASRSQARRSTSTRTALIPGLALTIAVSIASWFVAAAETRAFGHPILEALVVAIILGTVVRAFWTPPARYDPGIRFSAKWVLEAAVFLMGASVSLPLLLRAGPALVVGIVALVCLGITLSYSAGRLFGLQHELAVLVACGNGICGNSAIAAVAPVIDADAEHVASAVAFTAILGVAVVVGLPYLVHPLGLSFYQYGVLAGLTIYSVPQVLAAAFPVSAISGQVGTLVKLLRVLMLGPVVVFFAWRHGKARSHAVAGGTSTSSRPAPSRFGTLARFAPWFIVGFLILAGVRSAGWIPAGAVPLATVASGWLTIVAMAALGLGVDVSVLARVGRPVVLTVTVSLFALLCLALGLIHGLRIR